MEYEEDEEDEVKFELSNIAEINLKILKANDELFLRTNRSFFGWRSDVFNKDLVDLEINNINVKIPYGSFFYPCSGKDYKDPVSIFKKSVAEYHFSDPFNPIVKSIHGIAAPKRSDIIKLSDVGNVVLHNGASTTINNEEFKIVSHQKDGLLTFIDDIKSISIFYYRGDSQGEGGSGQFWLGPVLLDLILSRIINGGLIFTDWSNSYGHLAKKLQSMDAEHEFLYRDIVIKRLPLNMPGKLESLFVFK